MIIDNSHVHEPGRALHSGAEGAGKSLRLQHVPNAKSLRDPYIPAPKAPDMLTILVPSKGKVLKESLYSGAEGAGEILRC